MIENTPVPSMLKVDSVAAAEKAVKSLLDHVLYSGSEPASPRRIALAAIEAYVQAEVESTRIAAELAKPDTTPTFLKVTINFPKTNSRYDDPEYLELPRTEAMNFLNEFNGSEYDWPNTLFRVKVELIAENDIPEEDEATYYYSRRDAAETLCLIESH